MILEQIEDVGFAKGNQSVDATHVIANIAIPGTIGLIRQGIKAIMEEIETVYPNLFKEWEAAYKNINKINYRTYMHP